MCVCVHVHVCATMCVHVEVRVQLCGVGRLLPTGSKDQRSNDVMIKARNVTIRICLRAHALIQL